MVRFARGFCVALTLLGVVLCANSDNEAVGHGKAGDSISVDENRRQPLPDSCNELFDPKLLPRAKPIDREFSLLTWNIEKGQDSGWIFDIAHHLPEADILLFQEAALEAGQEQLSLPAKRNFIQYFAPGYQQGDRKTGVLTASRWTAASDCALTALEPWLGTPKATSLARFQLAAAEPVEPARDDRSGSEQTELSMLTRVGSPTLLIVNVHAINFALGLDAYTAQFEAIGRVIASHRGPLIVGGDFNTWSEQRTQWLEGFLGQFGLAGISFDPDYRTAIFSRPIDHVYVRGLEVISSRVIQVDTSDHNPLWIRVKLYDI